MMAARPGNRPAPCSTAERDASEPSNATTTGRSGFAPTSGTGRGGRGTSRGGRRRQDLPLLGLELLRVEGSGGPQAAEPLELGHPVGLAAVRDLTRGVPAPLPPADHPLAGAMRDLLQAWFRELASRLPSEHLHADQQEKHQ